MNDMMNNYLYKFIFKEFYKLQHILTLLQHCWYFKAILDHNENVNGPFAVSEKTGKVQMVVSMSRVETLSQEVGPTSQGSKDLRLQDCYKEQDLWKVSKWGGADNARPQG